MYIIDFDVVAAILAVISLYMFNLRKRVGNARSRRFAFVLWSILASSCFSILSSVMINRLPQADHYLVTGFTMIFFLFHNTIPMALALYILTITSMYMGRISSRILFMLPWVTACALILTTPLSHVIFYIDAASMYRHGPIFKILYSFSFIYLAIMVLSIFKGKKRLPARVLVSFAAAMLMPFLAIVIQNVYEGLMLECFSSALAGLFILLTIQNNHELLDGQTGLFTASAFEEFLQLQFNEDKSFPLLVVHLREISNFRRLYDIRTYTRIIHDFSAWLGAAAGKNSILFALDEGVFAILPKRRVEDGFFGELALTVFERSKSPWIFDQVHIEMQLHIGVLLCSAKNRGVQDVMDSVDQIVNLPEHIGNRHVFYESDLEPGKLRRDASIMYALKKVVDSDQPELRYQPVFSVSQSRFVALEVLIGVTSSGGEWIGQSEVLRMAEQMGIAKKLGEIIITHSCRWYVQNAIFLKGISELQIRLLESQSVELDWSGTVLRLIAGQGMNPENLCIEVTEPVVVNTAAHLKRNMDEMCTKNVTFALDDYGSGYTDLGRILEMPFKLIKLDKQIVHTGLQSDKGKALLAGSISMFRHLGYRVAAEGIESTDQSAALCGIGADYLQGYYFGMPLDGDSVIELLKGL